MKKILLAVSLLISSVVFSQVDLNLGLRAYYPFNGNANDESGNNNNPVFNNATLTSDLYGNPNSAYHFNGSDNSMKILNNPTLNMGSTMSICVKVKPTGFYLGPCENNMLLAKADGDFLSGTYTLRFADPVLGCSSNPPTTNEVFYGGRDGGGVIAPAPFINLNQWYSVVVTNDGNLTKIYVDCILRATTTSNQNSATSDYDLYLGHFNSAQYPYWFNGDLDEVRIYDRALNQDEVNLYGDCSAITDCNNWLKTQVAGQSVKVGDLDVSGTQITVEAQINRTTPYTGSYIYAGDVVSKHGDPSTVNYLLRPNDAEITTANGYYVTPQICDIDLNKNYHVAMVYDGSTLKFYRNGFLMSQVAATGNLFQNDYITTIGDWANYSSGIGTNFKGTINEVRIWNVARTQAQIRTYMNTSLPNPSTQGGLLAYYTFDNLVNKQGNTAWNGILTGAASINNTNSNCVFLPDSCGSIIPSCDFVLNTNITDMSTCPGGTVQLVASGAATAYSWNPSTGLTDATISNPVATVNTDIAYVVTGTFETCEKSDTVNIHVFPSPFANAGTDKTIDIGGQVMLDGSGSTGASILWAPSNTLTGANSFTPIAKPTVTTNYTLTVIDNNNCTATDDVKVIVKDLPCADYIEPVHAFTPNGDGINDKWLAGINNSCTVQVSVKVYNRYGSPVYKNENYQNDWQGIFKGKTLPDGTYYYVNIYTLSNGRKIERQGDVTILR